MSSMLSSVRGAKVQPRRDSFDDLNPPSGHQERCSGHRKLQALEAIDDQGIEQEAVQMTFGCFAKDPKTRGRHPPFSAMRNSRAPWADAQRMEQETEQLDEVIRLQEDQGDQGLPGPLKVLLPSPLQHWRHLTLRVLWLVEPRQLIAMMARALKSRAQRIEQEAEQLDDVRLNINQGPPCPLQLQEGQSCTDLTPRSGDQERCSGHMESQASKAIDDQSIEQEGEKEDQSSASSFSWLKINLAPGALQHWRHLTLRVLWGLLDMWQLMAMALKSQAVEVVDVQGIARLKINLEPGALEHWRHLTLRSLTFVQSLKSRALKSWAPTDVLGSIEQEAPESQASEAIDEQEAEQLDYFDYVRPRQDQSCISRTSSFWRSETGSLFFPESKGRHGIKERAIAKIATWKLQCEKTCNKKKQPSVLRRGEVEFSEHRAHYIIVPEQVENADEILQWMFLREEGWKLKPPGFFLSCYGGKDHYQTWPESPSLNRDAWANQPREGSSSPEPRKGFLNPRKGLLNLRKVASGGIFSSSEEDEEAMKQKETELQFKRKFMGRLKDIAAGICRAMIECGGWFDLGWGERGGLNEVLRDGLKTYWAAKSLAGHKTDAVVFCIRLLEDTEFSKDFEECAVEVPTTSGQSQGPVNKRVQYPSMTERLFPREPSEKDPQVRAHINNRFLCNALTHIVFVQNRQVHENLRSKLRTLASRATIFANGEESLIQQGRDGKILMDAMSGVPVVCLHHTGGAAEILGQAVLNRRHRKHNNDYDLPEYVPENQFLIVDPAKDSVEKVVAKLTVVLSTVQDEKMMQVGFAKSEETRLRYAWEQYLLYCHNADIFRKWAIVLQYTAMILSVLITIVAVLYSESRSVPGLFEENLKVCLLVLPCVSAFVLTSISRLNYVNKWAALTVGAVRVKSEIYQYRCRALDYQQATTIKDFRTRVEELCDGSSTDDEAKEALSPTSNAAKEKQRKSDEKQEKGQALPKGTSREGTFSAALEEIHSDAVGSDVRSDYLRVPPVSAMHAFRKSLYDYDSVCKAHDSRTSSSFFNPFKGRSRRILPGEDKDDTELDWPWRKTGVDFYQNPHAIDDEFLRDDGISPVTAEDYIHFRFLPMLQHNAWRSRGLSQWLTTCQVLIFFLTAVLAAATPLGIEAWIPVLVSIISFLTSMLEFHCFSSQLRNVNQASESLKNLHFWWQSLSMVQRRKPSNMNRLVALTEATADSEISAWQKALKVKNLNAGNSTAEDDTVENEDQAQIRPQTRSRHKEKQKP